MSLISPEHTVGVDPDWACCVVNACQAALGYALEGDPTCLSHVRAVLEQRIATPRNVTETLFACHSITLLLDRLGDILHRRFHDRFGGTPCRAASGALPSNPWPNPLSGVATLLEDWFSRYSKWFHAHHSLPLSLRAKQILHDRYAEPLTTQVLASAVGSSRTSLIEHFNAVFGISPAEYLARVRIREGLRRMRNGATTVEQAARSSGYQSVAKFAARVRRTTGLTPSHVRRLDAWEFDALLERRLSLLSRRNGFQDLQ